MDQSDLQGIRNSREAIAAGMPVFKVLSDGAIKAYKDEKGVRRFSLTASSDADDLAGDFFAEKALKRMQSTAKGMTMFLNHSYNVPDDVFGSVEEATLERKSVFNRVLAKDVEYLCLTYSGVVTEVNDYAVRTHDMMLEERVTLGGSVSVLITEKSNTKDGRRRIEDVVNLECSIVGLPCNPTAWAQSASKALKVGEAAQEPAPPDVASAIERVGAQQLDGDIQPDFQSDKAASRGETMKPYFKNAKAAIEKRLQETTIKACESCKGTGKSVSKNIESDCLVCKGRFTELLQQYESSIYWLVDVLSSALWDLYIDCVYYETDVDPTAELTEICDEFKATVIERLVPVLSASDDDGEKSLSRIDAAKSITAFLGFGDNVAKAIDAVAKVGRRNSGSDQKMIDEVHSLIVELGAECKSAADDDAVTSAAAPVADKTTATDAAVSPLEEKVASLTSQLAARETELTKALEAAEFLAGERDNATKCAEAAVLALEQYGLQPLN